MNPRNPLFLVLLLALTCSCDTDQTFAITIQKRDGPPFHAAFPDLAVLVKTKDPAAVRTVLDTVPMPDTQEHHDALLKLLADTSELDTDHLLLLTEAVAIPCRQAKQQELRNQMSTSVDGRMIQFSRGDGRFHPIIDELLLSGLDKIRDPSPRNFGRIIFVTQTTDTIKSVAARLQAEWDDGSPQSLQSILRAIPFGSIRADLAVHALLPNDRLEGERANIAIDNLDFDSNRQRVVGAVYARKDKLDFPTLLRHVKVFDFDSGRVKASQLGAPILEEIHGADAAKLVRTADFDSGRCSILETLQPKVRVRNFAEVVELVRIADFDSGRTKLLSALLDRPMPEVSGSDLAELLAVAQFDGDRVTMMNAVAPHVIRISTANAQKIVKEFDFDDGRVNAVQALRDHLRKMPFDDRREILSVIEFDSNRDKAREILGK